jgi:hypothetical protein
MQYFIPLAFGNVANLYTQSIYPTDSGCFKFK